jgi:group II intron reverse transcriptase/maturase
MRNISAGIGGQVGHLMVNGPAGDALCWDAVDWRFHEDNVRRLRQRIFTAARDGNLGTLRNLQKLMLRSWSNTLLSVRRATQRNAGRKTAGVDGEIALSSLARAELAVQVHRDARSWRPLPVKRVYIPKAGNRAKLRPLGIPVIADRCHQGRVRAALEPEWEARFEPRSYGFRPGRGCHDAISAVFNTCKGPRAKRVWALDADLAAAFDKIDHTRLLDALGSFPARDMIRRWLTAGVFEEGKGFAPTEEGTPQGGVISPLLLNVALHGLETAAGVRYITVGRNAGDIKPGSPVVIRYADDMIALCHSQRQAEQVKASLAEWLAPRGLVFNEDKTIIVPLSTGFDFLGFKRPPIRRGVADQTIRGGDPANSGTAPHRDVRTARIQRGGGPRCAHPHHSGLGGLLPRCGVVQDVQIPGQLPVEAHLQVGHPRPRQQTEHVGLCPLLREVQQVPERPLGVRRRGQRRLPGQVFLDRHRPAHPGHRWGVSGRPCPGRVLGRSATAHHTPAGWLHAASARQAERPLHPLRGRAALRRSATSVAPRMGTLVAADHPEGDRR